MCLFFSCHWCHSIAKVTSVTWHFCLSLHGDVLIISELYTSCNEWHEFLNLEKKRLHEFLKRLDVSPKTSATLPQLFFNNFKCFFNCYCYKLFLWLSSWASRRICKALVDVFFRFAQQLVRFFTSFWMTFYYVTPSLKTSVVRMTPCVTDIKFPKNISRKTWLRVFSFVSSRPKHISHRYRNSH